MILGSGRFLEKGMATHSSILAWKIPWTEEPGGLHTVHGVTESDTTEQLSTARPTRFIGDSRDPDMALPADEDSENR